MYDLTFSKFKREPNAGIGIPGPDGWEWQADNSLIQSIRSFVDIYRGTQQARYVEVPVTVK